MLKTLKAKIWDWPDGFVWRHTRRFTEKSRQRRFNLFLKHTQPQPNDKVLDVGVGEGEGRGVNFFEELYPYKQNITAVALENLPQFKSKYPQVELVIADGRDLPFPNQNFDLYFSNAVLEHVGTFEDQKQFIQEACRVANKVFLSTPYRWFPLDAHTMIPFAHFLPLNWRNYIYRKLGRESYATEQALRLVDIKELRQMIPQGFIMKVYPQRLFGLITNLNVLIVKQ